MRQSRLTLLILVTTLCLWHSLQSQVMIFDTAIVHELVIEAEHIINTPNSEYSPTYYNDKVGYVYSSDRGRQVDKVISEPFYDIGYAAKDTSGLLALSASFSGEINSVHHEGPFAVSGDILYFTRVVPTRVNGKKGYTRKIFVSQLGETEPAPMPWAADEYSTCHPTVYNDGLSIIFSGDLTNSGHMDLYTSSYIGEEWSAPQPIIGGVNTEHHEFFPFVFQDTLLIYGSDRPGGYGGYDMYVSSFRDGSWRESQLIPEPLNSRWDDIGMILRDDAQRGYFSSNRPGGEGKDDIYSFKSFYPILRSKKEEKPKAVTFTVLDKLRFTPLSNVEVSVTELVLSQDNLDIDEYNVDLLPGTDGGELLVKLSPKEGKKINTNLSDIEGKIYLELGEKSNYIITAKRGGYATSTFIYSPHTYGEQLDIVLEPKKITTVPEKKSIQEKVIKKDSYTTTPPPPPPPTKVTPKKTEVVIPKEVGKSVVFENILYESNSAALKPGATKELDILLDAMLLNPNMEIILSSHTDSKGDSNYNLLLSEERALGAKQYLVKRGINPRRIRAKGYGEQKIRNRCKEGVPCSKEEHQYNRRTEVEISKM